VTLIADLLTAGRPVTSPAWVMHPDGHKMFAQVFNKRVQETIAKHPIMVVNNVANLNWSEETDLAIGLYSKDAFPALAPPFPSFWMEYATPKWCYYPGTDGKPGEQRSTDSWDISRWGVYVESHDARSWKNMYDLGKDLNINFRGMVDDTTNQANAARVDQALQRPEGARWVLLLYMAVMEQGRVQGPTLFWSAWLDEYGQIIQEPIMGCPGLSATVSVRDPTYARYAFAIRAFLQAICFMNTKGIQHVPNKPGTKTSKAWQRKHGQPLHTFKTLLVEQVIPGGGSRTGTSGVERSHHIVRGHFSDYRNGPGLFGKHKVLVWRPHHVAGNKGVGTVDKNYNIRPPRKGSA